LNEKGMVPKDKGWGMSNLGYGEKPMFIALLFCHLVVCQPFNVQLVVGEVIAEVVVVVAGC